MHIKELLSAIAKVLPMAYALKGDKVGLQIDTAREIKRVQVVLEVTDANLDECIERDIDLIITFHPLIYSPLQEISFNERVQRLTYKLIQKGIGLISVHTAYDVHSKGTNFMLAKLLNITITDVFIPNEIEPKYGLGIVGNLQNPMELYSFLELVSKELNASLTFIESKRSVNKVAIIAGSGSKFIDKAVEIGCDTFLTSDTSYHQYFAAEGKINLIDPGHYEMEQFVPEWLTEELTEKIKEVEFSRTSVYTNPRSYYPMKNFNLEQKNYITN
jgi:dinuclear metal center YbgI/SA1388 family protein